MEPSLSSLPERHLSPSAGPQSPLRRWGTTIVVVMVALAAIAGTIEVPVHPSGENLDESWQFILSYAFETGRHFGRELVFTYGPLGWLENRVQFPWLFWPELAWQVASRAAVVVLIGTWVGFRLRFVAIGLALLVLCSTRSLIPMPDAFYLYALWIAGAVLLRRWRDSSPALAIGILAAFALVKFTLLLAAGGVVFVAVLQLAVRRQWRFALMLVGAFLAIWLVGWVGARQSITDIPAFLSGSWQVASSYTAAMARELYHPIRLVWASGAAALLLLLAMGSRYQPKWPLLLLTVGLLALVWRHSVSRPDMQHLSNVFVWIALVAASWPTGFKASFAVMAAAILGWASSYSIGFVGALKMEDVRTCMVRTSHAMIAPVAAYQSWCRDFAISLPRMPNLQRIVGDQVVDVHGYNQKAAILGGFNFAPRPIPQSYSAYSPALAERNLGWLARTAPRFSLVQMATIDDRVPTLDDGPALAWLLQNDRPRAAEGGFLLLERAAEQRPTRESRTNAALRMGEWFELPANVNGLTYLRLYPVPTMGCRMLQGIVPMPTLRVDVRDVDGRIEHYRLPWPMASAGFLVQPFVRSNDDLWTWYYDRTAFSGITAIRLTSPETGWFEPELKAGLTLTSKE